MGALRRTIHLIIALALTVVGCAEFVYLYFFAEAPTGWMIVVAGIMCRTILAMGRVHQRGPETEELKLCPKARSREMP